MATEAAEYDDDWNPEAIEIFDREARKPRLLARRCETCILGGANPIPLRPRRLKQLVKDAVDGGGHIVCHSTLSNTDPQGAICRGFYEGVGYRSNGIRIMERLGGFLEVDPPSKRGDGDV
jgi:hypothetical protein